jgi:DNA-binding NarL/FixJ family response regulator/HAMP domain-containing protein
MRSKWRPARLSLFTRVVLANAAVLTVVTLLLLFSPIEINAPVTSSQPVILVAGFVVSLAVSFVLLRRVVAPVRRLAETMRSVDPLEPGRRLAIPGSDAEVDALATAFNDMLDRLERERRESARIALAAQEQERLRIARELHDEVGQVLTGVMLELDQPQAREAVRRSLEDVRRIARELRPEALDHLGLQSAMRSLCISTAGQAGLRVVPEIDLEGVEPSEEVELAVYRVAQESLTNVARHAQSDPGRGVAAGRRRGPEAGRARRRAGAPAGIARRRRHHRHARAGRGLRMTVPLRTRILLADDHAMVRRGLRMVLEAEPDMTVVGEADDGAQAVELALSTEADLAVLDVAMPRLTGLQAAAELKQRRPELRTLMLSMYDSEQYFFEALKAGASGYVLKSAADRDLVEAVRAAVRGEPFLYPAAVSALIRDYLDRASHGDETPSDPLTARELEIVKLVAEGNTTDEIASTLVISKRTVEHHRSHILEKLGMRDRVELARYAIRRGLVEP